MNRSRYSGRNQNTIGFSIPKAKIGPVSNAIILIVLICLLGLLYLSQITKTDSYGYQINSMQGEQQQLEAQNQNLEVSTARIQSMSTISNSSVVKNMVPITPKAVVSN
jgi:hypothetical protein